MTIPSIGSVEVWIAFVIFVLIMLALDLGVFHRTARAVSMREAAAWSAIWVAMAAGFAVGVHHHFGAQLALQFATGYVIEKSLAVDNIFVFVVIFSTFGIPAAYQHRVLFWGVLGALVMRAAFIIAGGAFLQRFHWAIYVFGALLAATGVRLLMQRNETLRPEDNFALKLLKRHIPVTNELHGDRFTVVRDGRRFATPLLVALVAVEVTDLVFAVDSIPAIFAITRDPFIVFSSNIFAILGLRSMYFLLAGIVAKFTYLKVGLAAILVFVGLKMLLLDVVKVPTSVSLAVIALILATSIVASWLRARTSTAALASTDAAAADT